MQRITEEAHSHDTLRASAKKALEHVRSHMPAISAFGPSHPWKMNESTDVKHELISELRDRDSGFLANGEFLFFPSSGKGVVLPEGQRAWAAANPEWIDTDGRIYSAVPTDCGEDTYIRVVTVDQAPWQGETDQLTAG